MLMIDPISVQNSSNRIYSLDLANLVEYRIEAFGILDIEAQSPLEDAVVALHRYGPHVYAEIPGYDLREIQKYAHAVDSAYLDVG